ncbi:MAG: TonB-dependent receptor [Vicinamibacterales bacterium]
MRFAFVRCALLAALTLCAGVPAAVVEAAQVSERAARIRVVGTVRDEQNAVPLPGVPVEVVGGEIVYTDVDGRYVLQVPEGQHSIKVALDGYQEKLIALVATPAQRNVTLDVGLSMSSLTETVTVVGTAVNVDTSSASAQLVERKQAAVITDNLGSKDMRQNGDSDAASAMTRVTGISLVDNQYVFVRGLGERYSNTTLSGALLPTTEPDKKVVPLDLFPTGLIDSVQVSKSYSPDRSAEFAGGLVQIVPMKLPNRPVMDLSYGMTHISTATGQAIPLSPLGSRDVWGYDNGARALPSSFPNEKIVRSGIYTPGVGYSPEEITAFGRLLGNQWQPSVKNGAPGQNWNATFGRRIGKFGIVASATHQYREQFIAEERRFFRIADAGDLEAVSDYSMQTGTQRAQLGVVANFSYTFAPTQRVSIENFYTHSGRDEGRTFQGLNLDNAREYRNTRLQFIEEGLISNQVSGEHFVRGLSNSRVDWRVNYARAVRDEPALRETLYERLPNRPTDPFTYADESQSGFQMFNDLKDNTLDAAVNWSLSSAAGGRPTQYKLGFNVVDRARDFRSRRFHFIPLTTQKADTGNLLFNPLLSPEELFVSKNIGTAFRFNEETRPVDAYDGDQQTRSAYGMMDISFTSRSRMIVGARVENFDQVVNTKDPFGLFVGQITASNKNTDLFPSLNFVRALSSSQNLRVSYSSTVNRPEFRELAEFEFTDVVGNRAVRGNPNLTRAIIQNVDTRWEMFTGARGVLAASFFFKRFNDPIERIVIAAANPIATFQNSDRARNAGIELEAGRQFSKFFFVNANYTFVDSKITLLPEQRSVQTSLERPLAGQSSNLFNMSGEFMAGGFSTRVLYNYSGDRISDVGANQAPDIIEQGRGSLDVVFSQRVRGMNIRLNMDNLNNPDYRFTQTLSKTETQRLFKMGRTISASVTYSVF